MFGRDTIDAMTARLAAIVVALGCADGCRATGVFACATDPQCSPDHAGRCEAVGYCSFPDSACMSGRRFDEHAGGGLAGTCVGDEPIDDAGSCAWSSTATNLEPCAAALGAIQPSFEPAVASYELDTGNGMLYLGEDTAIPGPSSVTLAQTGGPMVRVLNLAGLELGSGTALKVKGPLPLVIVVHGAATIAGTITVEAGRAAQSACGQGGMGTEATTGSGAGGGGGGGFGAAGGQGGTGGSGVMGGSSGSVVGDATLSPLRGGCSGGRGGAPVGASGPDGGDGGGALQIIARDAITITGRIDARGRKGKSGPANASGAGGGGGGGSGGAVFLESSSVVIDASGKLCANGGSGGEGGSEATHGAEGNDGSCSLTNAATTSDASSGGNGGAGAFASTSAGSGGNGTVAADGGGGGGGGSGRIRIRGTSSRVIDAAAIITPSASQ